MKQTIFNVIGWAVVALMGFALGLGMMLAVAASSPTM